MSVGGRALQALRFALGLALATVGCERTATQLVVHVDTDLQIGTEIDGFELRVWDPEQHLVREQSFSLVGPDAVLLPATFGVAPRDRDPDRSVRIAVQASRPEPGASVLEARARTGYVEHERLRLDLFLARACIDVECTGDELTCRDGECDDEYLDPETLPREGEAVAHDAGPTDGGATDAGPLPAGTAVFPLRGEATFEDARVALLDDGTAVLVATFAGGVVVDGAPTDLPADSRGGLVAAVDPSGEIVWAHVLIPLFQGQSAYATGLATMADGSVLVIGTTVGGFTIDGVVSVEPADPTITAAFGLTFDAAGALDLASFGEYPEGELRPSSILIAPDGSQTIVGRATGTIDVGGGDIVDEGSGTAVVVSYDADGSYAGECTMSGVDPLGAHQLADGSVVVAGILAGANDLGLTSHGALDGLAVELGVGCAETFAHAVGGGGIDTLVEVTVDPNGRRVFVGTYEQVDVAVDEQPPLGLADADRDLVIAFEDDGSLAWFRALGAGRGNIVTAVQPGPADELWVAGGAGGFMVEGIAVDNAGDLDAFVLGLSHDGHARWARNFGGAARDLATDLAVDPEAGEAVLVGVATGPADFDGEVLADGTSGIILHRFSP